jgi:hypothetical protein
VNEKLIVGSPFFGTFSSNRNHKPKNVNVHFFIHSFAFMDELIFIPANSVNFLKLP